MSEVKKEEIKQEKNETIDINVALVLAENQMLKDAIVEKDKLITDLTKKLGQATDLIEEDTKSRLIADIKTKSMVPDKYLAGKSVEELSKMKEVLDTAVVPAFKSGTPVYEREDPKMKLDSVFSDFAKSTWRKNQ
jgi:hypothetical protein